MYIYYCWECHFIYFNQNDILEHFRDAHYDEFLRICPVCLEQFDSIGELLLHQKTAAHSGCNLCGETFPYFSSHVAHYLDVHCRVIRRPDDIRYMCFECFEEFLNLRSVQDHLSLQHGAMWFTLLL
ncbi:hypothetical protein ECG_09627 [Echinococcus granulosus]|uniref:Zinc finger C2H2 type n=1 Tax=Echinococcus granulosus TaxID=6210 RepID=A0A068WS59_ECHGR|nr:hypothetical protein ECG_09627 [Echinococcus granulosus]CDS20515.1 zinc finger C2H2 type [Echinococcus granulosus]